MAFGLYGKTSLTVEYNDRRLMVVEGLSRAEIEDDRPEHA